MAIMPISALSPPIRNQHAGNVVSVQPRSRTPPADLVRVPRSCPRRGHAVVFKQLSGVDARSHPPARASLGGSAMITPVTLAALLQRFFTQRLMRQRQASPHTISSYRDSFRQFLKFVQQRLRKPPSRLTFEEIDAPLIVAFLDELEKHQGVSVRSRNLRLTAIHSSFNTRLSRHPPILHRSSACSPSPASASPVPWSSSSL